MGVRILILVVALLMGMLLLAAGLMFAPPADVALIVKTYEAMPWGEQGWAYALGLVAVLFLTWWPLFAMCVLAGVAAWLFLRGGTSDAIAPYVEHIHAVEVALKDAREEAQNVLALWDGLQGKLDELFAQAAEMWLVVHPTGGIRRWNAPALTQARRKNPELGNLEGRSLETIVPAAALQQAMMRVRSSGAPWMGEIQLPEFDQWLLVWMLPLGDEVALVLRDVTHQHRDGNFAQKSELLVRQLVEESFRPIAVFDTDWRYRYVSFRWAETLGIDAKGGLMGQRHWDICPQFPANRASVLLQMQSGKPVGQEAERAQRNGQEVVYNWAARPWRDEAGTLAGYIMAVVDVTEFQRLKQQVAQAEDRENQLAYADALTGLPNRQLFLDRLNMALAQAYRQLGKVAVLFLDLDGFKGVNDRLGHAAGDLLLKQVAERLKTCIRGADTLARLGGDEFTMILNVRDAADAEVVAQKVLATIRSPYNLAGTEVNTVGTSIGIAIYPAHGTQAGDLIKAADNAMYAAKEAGKNTYRFATTEGPAPVHGPLPPAAAGPSR